jgi:hypothetical protein
VAHQAAERRSAGLKPLTASRTAGSCSAPRATR